MMNFLTLNQKLMMNDDSEFLNGMKLDQAKEIIIEEITRKKIGRKSLKYKLKDWRFLVRDFGSAQYQLFTERMER